MSRLGTVGEALDLALVRAYAELRACRDALDKRADKFSVDYDALSAFDDHMIEALDAVLVAAGAAGVWRTARVLQEAAGRHGFRLVKGTADEQGDL